MASRLLLKQCDSRGTWEHDRQPQFEHRLAEDPPPCGVAQVRTDRVSHDSHAHCRHLHIETRRSIDMSMTLTEWPTRNVRR